MNDLYLLTILLLIIACNDGRGENRNNSMALPVATTLSTSKATIIAEVESPESANLATSNGFPSNLGQILAKLVGKEISLVIDGHTFDGSVIFVRNNLVFLRGECTMGWFDWSKASGLILAR